ncbi:MAG: helix-turn-helix domain-containing protein [Phycisphaerae bacterium]
MSMENEIKSAMKNRNESLYRVAKGAGVSRSSLQRFMRGRQTLRLDKADRVANYLNIVILPSMYYAPEDLI